MKIIVGKQEMRDFSWEMRLKGLKIAFVPTMGYLHEGHLSLIKIAREHSDIVVVSIYVNPTQFAQGEDFDVYPRDKESDRQKLVELGVEACFEPQQLYENDDNDCVVGSQGNQKGHQTFVQTERLQVGLCGISRPHFFRGVATIVSKLFNIVQPQVAVFGLKDYQQWRVITTMARELDFPVQIIPGPIAREPDGLAMSSRNARLSDESREPALCISQALLKTKQYVEQGKFTFSDEIKSTIKECVEQAGGQIDYIEIVDAVSLEKVTRVDVQVSVVAVAAFFKAKDRGNVRLIDNMVLGNLDGIL